MKRENVINAIMHTYWVKIISEDTISVIASYYQQLENISEEYDLELIEKSTSASKLTVNGLFKFK